jgi:hypothetical protein
MPRQSPAGRWTATTGGRPVQLISSCAAGACRVGGLQDRGRRGTGEASGSRRRACRRGIPARGGAASPVDAVRGARRCARRRTPRRVPDGRRGLVRVEQELVVCGVTEVGVFAHELQAQLPSEVAGPVPEPPASAGARVSRCSSRIATTTPSRRSTRGPSGWRCGRQPTRRRRSRSAWRARRPVGLRDSRCRAPASGRRRPRAPSPTPRRGPAAPSQGRCGS